MTLCFCTLFDSYYLSRGLAMYESLKSRLDSFQLYVFAFDDITAQVITSLNDPRLTVITLAQFEDEDLKRVKPTRSKAEYCWTSTPSTILYCLQKYNLLNCTYIDADLFFYADPTCLIEEMGSSSVLITEHRSTPMIDRSKIAGKYCVQFITFKNNSEGLTVLKWWRDACIDWCYDRYEDGKFGDQKYLDDWTERFSGIHVLQNEGGGIAPWNIQQYLIDGTETVKFVRKKGRKTGAVIFYHFHYIKFVTTELTDIGWVPIPDSAIKYLYRPYLKRLNEIHTSLEKSQIGFQTAYTGFNREWAGGIKPFIKSMLKLVFRYNIVKTH